MSWLGRRKSAAEVVGTLLLGYNALFSADRFHQFVTQEELAKDTNIDNAIAEWHAFGMFVFTRCLWLSLHERERVFEILDIFQPLVLQSMTLNPVSESRFLEIAGIRETDYMTRFGKVSCGQGLATFFGYAYSRITGEYIQALEDLGIPQGVDALAVHALFEHSMDAMILIKGKIDQMAN